MEYERIIRWCEQMAPVAIIMKQIEQLPAWPSISAQDEICRRLHKATVAYPLSKRWTKSLLKLMEQKITQTMEGKDIFADDNIQVDLFSDDLIEQIVRLHSCQLDEDDTSFVTYHSMYDSSVNIRMRVLRLHNQVGCAIWEAGIMLGELFCRIPSAFRGKKVLELGSGVGITGLLLGRALPAADRCGTVIVTDFHDVVVDNMRYNLDLNRSAGQAGERTAGASAPQKQSEVNNNESTDFISSASSSCSSSCSSDSSSIGETLLICDQVDWSTVNGAYFEKYDADICFAADCTYSEDINVHLVAAFKMFLSARGALQRKKQKNDSGVESVLTACDAAGAIAESAAGVATAAVVTLVHTCQDLKQVFDVFATRSIPFVLIACTRRNPATLQHFLDTVAATEGLRLMDVTALGRRHLPAGTGGDETFYYFQNADAIQLYCICLVGET